MSLNDLSAALAAIVAGRDDDATHALRRVSGDGSIMARALLHALNDGATNGAYDEAAAFQTFIRAGGNVPLYASVGETLAAVYDERRPATLLDIGTGDGMALLPALANASQPPADVTVVEPHPGLLASLTARRPDVRAIAATLEAFAASLTGNDRWDLAQSTFALQSVAPEARREALRRLRPHVGELAIVEFDVPDLAWASDEMSASLARRYERAASEYGADAELVAGGFLAPMLLGQIRAARPSNWEQPIAAWMDELRDCGFVRIDVEHVHDYSWAPAMLLRASSQA
ncbi:hypothetical protein SAMN02800692_2692 [Luteibacter sp. UNC138MFCol5.1]|uniref:hypothetical protein n=1 Tax=Luteibacter sp. UNC138MFCol5.1 TaxID=1502774 RepID=UPI0008CFDB38|nr:hypothetical protein [Luteibacter sp. UNC138MFCol5.1]SEO90813.1 hypothetical protein SAMN02800692_2692 [Luteibacter sp. UNC138MFCol5.1]